jgi:3-hydroxybutyryl-CoA dehydrogenase
MILAVLASDSQKEEIGRSAFFAKHEVVYSENDSLWAHHKADAFLDLQFKRTADRISELAKLLPKPVLVNSVTDTLDEIHPAFIRINAWPGFLKGNYLEAAGNEAARELTSKLFGGDLIFVKDKPGFVSARILAMIVNEAHFTLDAGTSTREEIDTAMKLGTGYPLGPFEWANWIGEGKIAGLLKKLSVGDPVYEMAKSLKDAADPVQ